MFVNARVVGRSGSAVEPREVTGTPAGPVALHDLLAHVVFHPRGQATVRTGVSGVEMRAALVRETTEPLGLDDAELTDHHALVAGTLGTYSVRLGSGVVHRRPGNALCIIPVGSQHRGRMFLPFVDNDPRTSEVVRSSSCWPAII